MEFIFRLSNYDDPGLEEETAELLYQRLEARSRQVMPGMWKVTDKLNARQADASITVRRRKRYRIYGIFLTALGVFALVPGLMEPRVPSLIVSGGFAVIMGVWCLCLRERKPLQPPAFCKKEAAELMAGRQAVNWEESHGEIRFDGDGISISVGEDHKTVSYASMSGAFGTSRLWMAVYDGTQAILLQKKDLISGEAEAFLPYLQNKMLNQNLS